MNEAQTSGETVGEMQVDTVTAGALLRRAREAAGLHVTTLAAAIKISPKKLEALEADKFDPLSEAVFVRALASSVCRVLKIDPAPVLDKLPQNRVPRLNAGEVGINAPFHAPGQASNLFVLPYLTKPVFLAVLISLVAIGIIALSPPAPVTQTGYADVTTASSVDSTRSVVGPVVRPNSEVVGTVQGESVRREIMPTPTPAVVASPAPMSNSVLPPPATTPSVSVPVSPEGTSAAKADPTSLPVTMVPRNAPVIFKARAASWVEVIDAAGTVQLRRNLATGDTVGAAGALPLAVVVGRADALDVQVRGKAFDLTRFTNGGVARFEVK